MQQPLKSSMKKPKESKEKSEYMDPADDSFTVSPIAEVKYGTDAGGSKRDQPTASHGGHERVASKQPTGNGTISGLSEFDYLGKEDSDLAREEADNEDDSKNDGTRKSLDKEFQDAAEEDATQAESPVDSP